MYWKMENRSCLNTSFDMHPMDNAVNIMLVQSLQFVIAHFFVKKSTSFVITISCRSNRTYNFYKHILELLLDRLDKVVIQLVFIQNGQPVYVAGPRYYNLYFVDSLQGFLDADPIKYASNYDTNEFYYILLQEENVTQPQQLEGIFDYCWQHQLINCNVQLQNAEGRILVYSYLPFTSMHCGDVRPKLINEFIGTRMLDYNIFPKKLLNLHRCKLRVATWQSPPFIELRTSPEGIISVHGFEGHLLQEIARRLNFTIEVVKLLNDTSTKHGVVITIGDYILSAMNQLKNRSVDITLGYLRENRERNQEVSCLFSHYKVWQVISVLRSTRKYTSLEILGFPFQSYSWWMILLALLGGTFGILLVCSWRNDPVTAALFNFIAITMGLATHKLPRMQYKRVFYINWTLCSFILRSIYSALLYDLFCRNLYQPPPDSMEQLRLENYSFVFNMDVYYGITEISEFREQRMHLMLIDSIEEAAAFAYLEQNHGLRLAAIGAKEILLYYGRQKSKPGLFHILPEVVMTQPLTIYLTKHSFLIDQLNDYLQRMHAVGLMEGWLRSEIDERYFHSRHMEDQKFIGQNELNGIYYICGCLMVLASMVFLVEICISKWKKYIREKIVRNIYNGNLTMK